MFSITLKQNTAEYSARLCKIDSHRIWPQFKDTKSNFLHNTS